MFGCPGSAGTACPLVSRAPHNSAAAIVARARSHEDRTSVAYSTSALTHSGGHWSGFESSCVKRRYNELIAALRVRGSHLLHAYLRRVNDGAS